MILRSLRVAGWRCFAEAVEIGPFVDGLNVVHGPNGSGKSTLLWAMARGLFDSYKVSGADVDSLRPWGRPLNPCVTIEFEHGGAKYRLAKQFCSGQIAELARFESGKFSRLAEAVKADEIVRQLLSAEPPKRGTTEAKHWGFAQVLWATQGALQIKELNGGIHNTIRDSLGAQVAGVGADELESRVAAEFGAIFTPTGKFKGGASEPRIVAVERELGALRDQRAQIVRQLELFDNASREIENLRSSQNQLQQQASALERELHAATAAADQFAALVQQRDLLHEKSARAKDHFDRLDARSKAISNARRALHDARERLKKLADEQPTWNEQLRQTEADRDAARAALASLLATHKQIDQQQQIVRRAEQYLKARDDQRQLETKLEDIAAQQQLAAEHRAARARLIAPDAATLRKIKQLHSQRQETRLLLDAAMITLTIEPLQPLTIEVTTGEQIGASQLAAGQPLTLQGSPEVALTLAGIGVIRARGPAGSAAELRTQLREADEEFTRLTAGLGTDDVALLEERVDQAKQLDRDIQQSQQQAVKLLAGQTLEGLQSQAAQLQQAIAEFHAASPDWHELPPDVEALTQQARELADSHERDEKTAITRQNAAENSYNDYVRRHAERESQLKGEHSAVADGESQLATLTADGIDDSAREEQLNSAALAWRGEQAALKQSTDQLAILGEDPRATAKTLQQQRESLRNAAAHAERRLIEEETRLKGIIDVAPYSKLAEIEESQVQLEQELARQRVRTGAIKLLHETIQAEKSAAVAAVIEPVERRASRTLQRIAGGRFETITFDDSFLPTGVRAKSHADQVALGYLSGGEQEQVHFAVRLALAEVAFGEERQLVVLDDAFTATDTPRLARIIKILEEAAQRFQVVLLSCHPERYAHLQGVKFFDLVQLASAQAGEHAA